VCFDVVAALGLRISDNLLTLSFDIEIKKVLLLCAFRYLHKFAFTIANASSFQAGLLNVEHTQRALSLNAIYAQHTSS